MLDDSYKTIRSAIDHEMKEKGSRFICHAHPVKSRENAENIISSISKQFFDATHNCFAYRIGLGQEEITRFNDDGEPSGTAGKPILQAIEGHDLTNVVVVVTRYFGGTKLGTGGLIRAYGGVTAEALDLASIKTVYLKDTVFLTCTYHHLNIIMALIDKVSGRIVESDYGEHINLTIQLRRSLCGQFIEQVFDKTAGQVKPEVVA